MKLVITIVVLLMIGLALIIFPEAGKQLQSFASIPLTGAMTAALFLIFREQIAHDRAVAIMNSQHGFTMGASSHMANVAFDKHAEFCEKYLAEIYRTVSTLFKDGPAEIVGNHASSLFRLRMEYVVWLNTEIDQKLLELEEPLAKISELSHEIRTSEDNAEIETKRKERLILYKDFLGKELLADSSKEKLSIEDEKSVTAIIQKVRAILDVEALTKIRAELIKKAQQQTL